MASYAQALDYARKLHDDTGKRVRVYGVKVPFCCCANSLGPHIDFKGYEWYGRTLPAVPLQLPDLTGGSK